LGENRADLAVLKGCEQDFLGKNGLRLGHSLQRRKEKKFGMNNLELVMGLG
jgi:hypothetical protein